MLYNKTFMQIILSEELKDVKSIGRISMPNKMFEIWDGGDFFAISPLNYYGLKALIIGMYLWHQLSQIIFVLSHFTCCESDICW
jgi:hypothetical protein